MILEKSFIRTLIIAIVFQSCAGADDINQSESNSTTDLDTPEVKLTAAQTVFKDGDATYRVVFLDELNNIEIQYNYLDQFWEPIPGKFIWGEIHVDPIINWVSGDTIREHERLLIKDNILSVYNVEADGHGLYKYDLFEYADDSSTKKLVEW